MFLGAILGIWGARLKTILTERKLVKNAIEIIEGKRKNIMINEDGKKVEITKFILRDEKGNKIVVNITGESANKKPILSKEENIELNTQKKHNGKEQKKGFIKRLLKR